MTRIRPAVLAAVAGFGALSAASLAPAAAAVPQLFHQPNVAVHAASGWASTNWSGYAKKGSYSAVTGRWTVPSVSASVTPTYSSSWIGIDGFTNRKLIQTGTASEYWGGAAHYYAWWEILPVASTRINSITVHPGDVITASIHKLSGSSWSISITDTTSNGSYTATKTYNGPGTSVEWIQEAPTVNGLQSQMAHYSNTTFDPGTANGGSPALTSANGGVMVDATNHPVSTPSKPDADRDGFTMAYGSSPPPPPPS